MTDTLSVEQKPVTNTSSINILRNRNFRLLWIGEAISLLGDQFYMIALLYHIELTLAELEREVSFHLDDLNAALALMAKVADLYPRLDRKQQGILLQILTKQIIVDTKGRIIEHELSSPFV